MNETECIAIELGLMDVVPCNHCGCPTDDPYMFIENVHGITIETNYCGYTCMWEHGKLCVARTVDKT